MLVRCENCAAKFEVDDNRLLLTKADANGKRKLRCAFCKAIFYVDPPRVDAEAMGGEMEEQNPDLMGTMVLNLTNKPKASMAPPPKKKSEPAAPTSSNGLLGMAAVRAFSTAVGGGAGATTPGPEAGASGETAPVGELKRVMAPPARKIELLGKSGWMSGGDWEEIKIMAPYWELYRASDRTTLFRPGDKGAFVALVVKGELRLVDPAAPPGAPPLAVVGTGKSCGEITVLDGKPHAALAVTTQETFVLILTKARLEEMFKEHHRPWKTLTTRLMQGVCRRARELNGAGIEWLGAADASPAPPASTPTRSPARA